MSKDITTWSEQKKADTLVNIYILAKWGIEQSKKREDANKRNIRKQAEDAQYVLDSMIEGFIFDVEESGANIKLTTEQITALRRKV